QVGTTGRIQEGVNTVNAGGTVHVAAGTYAENVTIAKALSLLGAQAGQAVGPRFAAFTGGPSNPQANPASETVLTAPVNNPTGAPPGANDLLRVLASNVTIDGFVFDGNTPALGASSVQTDTGVAIHARRAITNIDAGGGLNPVNNLVVK